MINQQYTGSKGVYYTSHLLGKGGEGEVYDLLDRPSEVLKIYSEPLSKSKASKLQLMVNRFNDQMQAYAAWPTDLVKDKKGKPCGFVMKKLDQYVPLHMLFSPMDRKKIFPDKGYNFLVHVARNIATAFHSLHAAGLVVGDVNEGNLLVNSQGMVAFIDCDSFQLSEGKTYYFCEVGVPRYTPPELLRLNSFENVVRTTATDSFSMAILIFQLLFLGRHPFAGVNHTSEDIGEEIAIQRQLFAYSTRRRQQTLTPPKDSFDITNLPESIAALFHEAFETVNRPAPAQWIKETNQLLQQMATCTRSKLHSYPAKMNICPWCEFRAKRNILYFIDDVFTAETSLSNDFEKFIQGFRVEPLHVPEPDLTFKSTPRVVGSNQERIEKYQRHRKFLSGLLTLISIGLCFVSFTAGFAVLALAGIVFFELPWKWYLKSELKKFKDKYQQLAKQLNQVLATYRSSQDLDTYQHQGKKIQQLISQYSQSPKDIQLKKRLEEERIYNQQLHAFLQQFILQDHAIPNFGTSRKQALYNAGIRTASDITKLGNIKVQGIGPQYEQLLLSWQRQMASGFVYHPNNQQLNQVYLKIIEDAANSKKQLETEIKSHYNALLQLKQHILLKRKQLQTQITDINQQTAQANAELQAFRQLMRNV